MVRVEKLGINDMTTFYPFEYLSVLKKWKWVFMIVFFTITLAFAYFAKNWSAYTAFATVEIAMPEIEMNTINSGDNVIATGEAIADLQISRLRQKVFSTQSLSEIIAKLNLYPKARKNTPITYIADNMRDDISFELIGTTMASSASAQRASAQQLSAIAFVIKFKYSDPALAQKTVNEIVTRFLNEDVRERGQIAKQTSRFLQDQIDSLSQVLEDQESKISTFRTKNGFMQSDSLNFNQQGSINTSSRLMSLDSEITANIGRIGALKSQLLQIDPYLQIVDMDGDVINTPGSQLRILETQYASLSARYGDDHPDVLKAKRELSALRKSGVGKSTNNPDNPTYLQLITQIESAKTQQVALVAQKEQAKAEQLGFQRGIANNPEAEKAMASLTRDYDNMMGLYRDLKAKKLASDINKTIEEGHVGRRLAVIDPAKIPLSTNPPRKLIFAGGVLFAFITAFSCVALLQLLSPKLMGPHHLQSIIGVAPLVRIPHIKNSNDNFTSDFEKTLDKNQSTQADIFRFLRTQILQKMKKEGYRTLAISSPRYGDGKSTIACNLAVSIAQDLKQTALLVDLDLRNPSIDRYMGMDTQIGLTHYLSDKARVEDCLVRPAFKRISVFPAGDAIDQSSETLGSPEMKKLAQELKHRYDDRLIIYDLPPLLQQDDPLVFLPHVDAFILVVQEGKTTSDEIKRSLEILQSANILGVVLNVG